MEGREGGWKGGRVGGREGGSDGRRGITGNGKEGVYFVVYTQSCTCYRFAATHWREAVSLPSWAGLTARTVSRNQNCFHIDIESYRH